MLVYFWLQIAAPSGDDGAGSFEDKRGRFVFTVCSPSRAGFLEEEVADEDAYALGKHTLRRPRSATLGMPGTERGPRSSCGTLNPGKLLNFQIVAQ